MSPKRFQWAYRVWPILVAAAKRRQTMTYEEVNERLGIGGALPVLYALWPIQELCKENRWPPLTSIVVNKRTGRPGSGCFAFDSDLDAIHPMVFAFPWHEIPRPFSTDFRKRLERAGKGEQSGNGSGADPAHFSVPDHVASVNGRGPFQAVFRKILIRVYGGRCALCDTRLKATLIAAHIVPWSCNQDNRLNPQNGLLLCLTHDSLFASGIITITPEGRVSWPAARKKLLGDDLYGFVSKRTASRLPRLGLRYRPDPNFLQWRLENVEVSTEGYN
jgi:putative restriction endonuclease